MSDYSSIEHQESTPTPKNESQQMKPWLRVVLFLIVYFIVLTIFVGLVFYAMGSDGISMGLEELYVSQIISLLVTCGMVWLFRTYIDKQSMMSLGFAWKGKAKDAAIGFGLGFGLIALGTVFLMLLGELKIKEIQFDLSLLIAYFILCILISLNEEILIRGYVLNNFMQSMGKYWALIVSALIFTFFHALNPNINLLAVINLMLAGILLGVYYIHQQNLWFPVALHISWNYSEGAIFGYEVSGIDFESLLQQNIGETDWLTGGEFGFEGSLLLSVMLVVTIWVMDKWYSK